jgi:DNA gyrase subunit A
LTHEGKGTIRLLSGFGANKEPGGGGKVAIKAERVVAAPGAGPQDDLFVLSRLGKVIRFQAADVPAKEGVVQGVNCMNLRADECVACIASPGSGSRVAAEE